jgi:hypothetical protein
MGGDGMAEEPKMNFYKSVYDLASVFPEKGRKALLVAMLDYFFEGIEPDALGAKERKAFEAVRGRIDASKTNGNNRRGKKRGESHNENGNESHNENANSMGTDISPSLSLSHSYSSGMDEGCNPHWEGVQGEGFTPPSLEDVKAYFETNGLKGDHESFFATYDSQGWVKGNGMPVHSWHSLALKWSQEERRRELDKPPEQQSKPSPTPVNLPDKTLEEDVAEFERRYGVKLRG